MRAVDYNADGYNDLLVNGIGKINALYQQQASPGRFIERRRIYDPDQ